MKIFPSIPAHKGPGVYKITDETNGKVYIGSSQNDTTVSTLLSQFVKDTLDAAGMLPDPKAPADPAQDQD